MTYNLENVSKTVLSELFKMSAAQIDGMVRKGCPQKPDKSFSIPEVLAWREEYWKGLVKDPKRREEVKRLKKQTKFLELRNKEIEKKTIPRSRIEEIAVTQATELRNFLMTGMLRNVDDFVMKTREEATNALNSLVKDAMDAFTDGGKNIDDL